MGSTDNGTWLVCGRRRIWRILVMPAFQIYAMVRANSAPKARQRKRLTGRAFATLSDGIDPFRGSACVLHIVDGTQTVLASSPSSTSR